MQRKSNDKEWPHFLDFMVESNKAKPTAPIIPPPTARPDIIFQEWIL